MHFQASGLSLLKNCHDGMYKSFLTLITHFITQSLADAPVNTAKRSHLVISKMENSSCRTAEVESWSLISDGSFSFLFSVHESSSLFSLPSFCSSRRSFVSEVSCSDNTGSVSVLVRSSSPPKSCRDE